MPNIYDRFVNYFDGPETPKIEVAQPSDVKKITKSFSVSEIYGSYYTMMTRSLKNAYANNYIVHRCVYLLSSNLSKIPLRVYKGDKPMPSDFVFENGFDIKRPHPRMSMSKLLYEAAVYYWYKGEFMVLIDEEGRFSLEPVNPSKMLIKKTDGGVVDIWTKKDSRAPVPSEKLVYANVFNPDIEKLSDENRTLSHVKVVEAELNNYMSGREFNTQFFKNFAQMGLTLKDIGAMCTDEERQIIVDELDNTVKAGNAWRTRALPQGMDVADTKQATMKEMRLNEMFKDLRDTILGVYGIPRSVFGITNEAGLAQNTVDAEKRIFWTDTIQPVAFQVQEAFNQTLMRRHFPGYKVAFDYSGIQVLQSNMTDKADLALKYQALGYTTEETNNILDLGMEKSSDARLNDRFVHQSLNPYSEVIEEEEKPEEDEKMIEIIELVEEEEKYSKLTRKQKQLEKKLVSKLGGYFAKQLGKVLGIVKTEKDTIKMLSDVLDLLNEEKEVLGSKLEPIYAEYVTDKEELEKLKTHIGVINNHTYNTLKKQINESLDAKETKDELAKRVQTVYKINKSKSRKLAYEESLEVFKVEEHNVRQ